MPDVFPEGEVMFWYDTITQEAIVADIVSRRNTYGMSFCSLDYTDDAQESWFYWFKLRLKYRRRKKTDA